MNSFQDKVDWKKLAKQQARIEALVPLSRFKRLCGALTHIGEEPVSVKVLFSRDNEYRYFVSGEMQAQVDLECQRCMSSLPHTLNVVSFQVFMVVSEEQQNKLPSELDALLVDEDELDLMTLLEDELLLQLPFTIFHEEIEACDPAFRYTAPEIKEIPVEKVKENPFQVLEALKKT